MVPGAGTGVSAAYEPGAAAVHVAQHHGRIGGEMGARLGWGIAAGGVTMVCIIRKCIFLTIAKVCDFARNQDR